MLKKLQLCSEAMHHDKNKHCLLKFWYKWKAIKYKTKLFQLSTAAAIKLYKRRCKLKFMRRWMRYVKIRLIAQKMFSTNSSKTMSKCFMAWSRHSIKSNFERQTSSRHNAICQRFLHSLFRKTTIRCFKTWRHFSAKNQRSRYLRTKVIKRMDNALLAMGFKTWVDTSKQIGEDNVFLDEIYALKQQIMEQELEKKKYSAIECFSVLLTDNLSARGKNGVIM